METGKIQFGMNEGKRVEIRELDLKVVADLCQAIFFYARGGDFRPVPQGDVLWLSAKLLGLGRYNGRFSFVEGWKKICWSHGLDPATCELVSEADFETAVRALAAKNEHRHRVKEGRRAKSELEAEGSNGQPELASEVLTPLAASSDPHQSMLRQIKRRLGPAQAPLPDPKSLYAQQPARAPIPAQTPEENLGSSSCQPIIAKVSRYTNCS